MQNRRTFLAGIGAASTVAVAGCTGILGDGAEDAVEQYFEAATNGDVEAQEEVVHDEALFVPIVEEEDEFDADITTIERQTDREFLEEEEDDVSDEDIEELESEMDEILEELDADEHAFVYYSIEEDDGQEDDGQEDDGQEEEGHVLVVADGEDWLLASFI